MEIKKKLRKKRGAHVRDARCRAVGRRPEASVSPTSGDLIKAAMKKKGNGVSLARKGSALLRADLNGKRSDPSNGASRPLPRGGATAELEQAIQRYVDLYDFAPIGYVSFSRDGRIAEINLAAIRLLGGTRARWIGNPFAMCVAREDTQLFLHHLLRCRTAESRVETELRLKSPASDVLHVLLSSTPTSSSLHDGALLFQTALVDLTERKRAEAELRRSERRYRTLFDFAPVGVYACDAKGLIVEFNQRAAGLWGRQPKIRDPAERFCGSFKIFYPDGRPMAHKDCPMARVLRGEKVPPRECEIVVEREDGGRRNLAVHPTALKNDRGKIIGAINSLYDITQRKLTEQSLAESALMRDALYRFVEKRQEAKSVEDIYAAGLEVALSGLRCDRAAILLYDAAGTMRFVAWHGLSPRYRRAVDGHSPWKCGAKNPQPVAIDNIDFAKISKSLKVHIRTEGIRAIAFIPLVARGKLIGKMAVYYDEPHFFPRKQLNLALNIGRQLALGIEHKKADEALRQSEELHRAFVNQTQVGMARGDLKGRIVFLNREMCQMLGYEESDLIGRRISDITHQDDRAETRRLFRRLVRKGESYQTEKRYIRKDGSVLWVSVSASPTHDAKGRIQAAVAVVRDVSDRKRAQALLEERARGLEGEILEISDREQRRIGQELHDSLCQHLTAVAFMSRSMATRLRKHRVIDVEDIEKIAELINDGVTEARTIARGLHPVEMDPNGLVDALQSLLQKRSRLPYRLDLDEELSFSDPTVALHLYRIASEAVINANKHARARELVLRMRSSPKQIELSVTDDGVGLGKKSGDGAGMGFHIMDYRARSIGARLEVTPVKPHGTRVACYVPRQ